MERRRANYYDDMDPQDGGGENGSLYRMVRILVTALMLLLIAAAAGGLYWMVRNDRDPEPVAAAEAEAEEEEPETVRAVREALAPDGEEEPQEPPEAAPEPEDEEPEEDATPEAEEEPEPVEGGVRYRTHMVRSGETIDDIAREHELDPRTIVSVNQIASTDEVQPGSELQIPDRDGQQYTIRRGDSLARIANSFGMGYLTLAQENNLDLNSVIYPGDTLFIPRITMSSSEYQRIIGTFAVPPVGGNITTPFRAKTHPITQEIMDDFPGVEYAVPKGTAVSAAAAGRVTGVLRDSDGLGIYIELSHEEGYRTVYGHLDRVHVEEDQQVRQGEQIAESGSTGLTLQPVLYFSISKDGIPLDPETFF